MGTEACGSLSHIVYQREEHYTVIPIEADKWLTVTNVLVQESLWIALLSKRMAKFLEKLEVRKAILNTDISCLPHLSQESRKTLCTLIDGHFRGRETRSQVVFQCLLSLFQLAQLKQPLLSQKMISQSQSEFLAASLVNIQIAVC